MEGKFYINGKDIYTTFGAIVAKGGLKGLLSYPPIKKTITNDWAEFDGTDVDLSHLYFDKHRFNIDFYFIDGYDKIESFFSFLSSSVFVDFSSSAIGRTWKLKYVSSTSLDYTKEISRCSVTFVEDSTYQAISCDLVSSLSPADCIYTLDDKSLSDYGVRVLKGTFPSIITQAGIKQRLERNIDTCDGIITDDASGIPSRHKEKDVTINCLLTSNSITDGISNYYCLLHDLIKPNPLNTPTKECLRQIKVKSTDQIISCYYKNQSVSDLSIKNGKLWLMFTITMTTVENPPIYLTTTEDNVLTTESGLILAI